MLFNTIDFALFLPLVFGLYWFVAGKSSKSQNALVVVANYIFYGWWDWRSLFLSFPGYHDISYAKSAREIDRVNAELRKNGLTLLGTPKRYRMPDSLLFDLPYHLTKAGADYRTRLLIQGYEALQTKTR